MQEENANKKQNKNKRNTEAKPTAGGLSALRSV